MDLMTLLLEIAGLFLTLMVLLYIFIGDNALFRLVTYVFIGAASAYVAVILIFQVLWPRLLKLIDSGDPVILGLGLVPFVLGLLLLFKLSPRLSGVGTLPMAILVGIGAAVVIGGAVFGTIFGQVGGTIGLFSLRADGDILARLVEGVFVLIGTICTLAYFQFSTRGRPAAAAPAASAVSAAAPEAAAAPRRAFSIELLSKIGQVFIGITLGAMFAGVLTASITALLERIGFSFNAIVRLIRLF